MKLNRKENHYSLPTGPVYPQGYMCGGQLQDWSRLHLDQGVPEKLHHWTQRHDRKLKVGLLQTRIWLQNRIWLAHLAPRQKIPEYNLRHLQWDPKIPYRASGLVCIWHLFWQPHQDPLKATQNVQSEKFSKILACLQLLLNVCTQRCKYLNVAAKPSDL